MYFLLFFFFLFPLWVWAGKFQLNSNPLYELSYTTSNDIITLSLKSSTKGFLGLGFGSSTMAGSDITIFYFASNGTASIVNGLATGHALPDTLINPPISKIKNSSRDVNSTSFTVERRLNPENNISYRISTNASTPMIWSLGESDELVHHQYRGIATINFGEGYAEGKKVKFLTLLSVLIVIFTGLCII